MAKKRIAVKFEDDPGRSIPLNFDLSCPTALDALCHWCTGDVLKFNRMTMKETRSSTLKKIENAVDLILANLINAYKTSRHCFVGISLDANAYTKSRYRQRQISYLHLRRVLQWLIHSNPPFSSFIPGFSDRRGRVRIGRMSRFKATEHFLIILARYKALTAASAHGSLILRSLNSPALESEKNGQ